MTLQRRVTFALLALVSLFTLLLGGLAVLSMHEQEDELVDELVATEARRLAARLDRGGPGLLLGEDPLVLADHYRAWWLSPDGRSLPGPLPAALARLPDGPHREAHTGEELHLVVLPAAGGRLFLEYDAEQNEAKVREFGRLVLLLSLLFVALAAVLARYLAALLVAPLERVTRLLDHWAPALPGEALPGDEETRLLGAFRRVQARWEQGLARESQALANLRHEVRTPLAALRTDLEMLQGSEWATDASQSRLQRALTAVDAVAGALAAMSALDRRESGLAEPVPLADCVDDAWASLGDLPAERGLRLHNEVPAADRLLADRHALLTILRNLVRNAAEHAAPGQCRVRHLSGRLVVEDDGPGVAADELPFVFDRYYRGRLSDAPSQVPAADSERGLGLAIARQVAQMHGWQLSASAVVPHGLRLTLDLSAHSGT